VSRRQPSRGALTSRRSNHRRGTKVNQTKRQDAPEHVGTPKGERACAPSKFGGSINSRTEQLDEGRQSGAKTKARAKRTRNHFHAYLGMLEGTYFFFVSSYLLAQTPGIRPKTTKKEPLGNTNVCERHPKHTLPSEAPAWLGLDALLT